MTQAATSAEVRDAVQPLLFVAALGFVGTLFLAVFDNGLRSPETNQRLRMAAQLHMSEARLRAIGAERYHDKHPFHALLHSGQCTKTQVQAWALNRYYYQSRIPLKDASILARMENASLRRAWRQRILDQLREFRQQCYLGVERFKRGEE